jgi:hypothetical protein
MDWNALTTSGRSGLRPRFASEAAKRFVWPGGWVILALLALAAIPVRAHDPLNDLPPPTSAPEAWNVINQSLDNVGKCLDTNQLKEIVAHVSNCSPAIRVLQAEAKRRGDAALVAQLEKLYYSGDAIVTAIRQADGAVEKGRAALAAHGAAVKGVATKYPPEVLAAQVYNCPMHPLERSVDPKVPCPKCSMKLIRRRIPASTTYEKPGEPSMKLTATPDQPLAVGQQVTVTVMLTKNDGTPVTRRDLLTMHTEKIHLLIVDAGLSDYHHEHPTPIGKPGEYVFTFTPAAPGPYRVFADVVPAESSVQEYVIGDIPAAGTKGRAIEDKETRLESEVDGFRFALKFDGLTAEGGALKANRPTGGELTVVAPDGVSFNRLEPVMAAFAHLVAFNEDGRTVLHIHPEGPEPDRADARGGPTLRFKLYAPTPGFYRLYAQVQIKGEQKFAPFNVTVGK